MSKKNTDKAPAAPSPRKAMAVTVLCAVLVIAGVLATLTGMRFVLLDDSSWAVSGYVGFSDSIEIPDTRLGMPVTSVSKQAFFLSDLQSVKLGANVTELNGYAFYGCSQLESIKLNYGLTTIGEFCFSECTGLEEISIPSTVTEIHFSAFSGCDDLTIIAPAGSYAANFAISNDITWKSTFEAFAVTGS